MTATMFFPPEPPAIGDVLVWELGEHDSVPFGATDHGFDPVRKVRICTKFSEVSDLPWPRPSYMFRRHGVTDSGTGVPWKPAEG